MIEFRYRNTDITLSFSFFALFAVLFYTSDTVKILVAILACMLHEGGHLLVMTFYGCYPQRLLFYGGGVKIVPNCRIISFEKEIFVYSAGCLANIITGIILLKMNIFPVFATANISLGIFNLLPFKAFDGGQILKLFFDNLENQNLQRFYSLAVKAICIGIIFCGLFFVVRFKMSVSLAVTICYIIISEVFC